MLSSIDNCSGAVLSRPPGTGLFKELMDRLLEGEIIPFLGAGASAFAADQDGGAPPSADNLSAILAERAEITITYDDCNHRRMNLARIASYYQHCTAPRHRLDALITTAISNPRFRPNILHRFLAGVALKRPLLIISTNYDNLLEQAFESVSAPFEVVATAVADLVYADDGGAGSNDADQHLGPEIAGGVLHWVAGRQPPQEDFERIEGQRLLFDLRRRSVIYKVHGTVPLTDSGDRGYLLAEEDYTRFLGRMQHGGIVPGKILTVLNQKKKFGKELVPINSLLFLGYSIRDWNLQVLLEELGISHGRANEEKHYAIMRSCEKEEVELLGKKNIKVYDCDLGFFASEMSNELCKR
jgi:SIR2-like domain